MVLLLPVHYFQTQIGYLPHSEPQSFEVYLTFFAATTVFVSITYTIPKIYLILFLLHWRDAGPTLGVSCHCIVYSRKWQPLLWISEYIAFPVRDLQEDQPLSSVFNIFVMNCMIFILYICTFVVRYLSNECLALKRLSFIRAMFPPAVRTQPVCLSVHFYNLIFGNENFGFW